MNDGQIAGRPTWWLAFGIVALLLGATLIGFLVSGAPPPGRLASASVDDLSALYAKRSNDNTVRYYLSRALMRDGQTDRAYRLMIDVVKHDPTSIPYLLKLAEYAAARGHASEAADAYRRVIALEPRNAVAHSELGHILGAAGLWADGLREYDQAIKIDGSVQRHTETYAECLVHAHRYEEAWRELTDAFNSTPQLDRGYELLTEAGINLHKFDETEMWLLRRIDMDKEYPVNQFQACLGRLELAKPRTPSSLNAAAQWARAATEKRRGTWEQHPVKADYFALYARVQLADNQVASARASLLRGLKLEPTNVECLKEMVQLAERTKDSATAKWRAAYAKASGEDGQVVALRRDHALRPSDAAASTALAAALEKSGRSGEAADLCLDVLSAAPQNGAANAILDQCRADGLRRLDAEGARRYAAMGSP